MSDGEKRWLGDISARVGNYISGFVDGEGSFHVSLRQRSDHTMQWQAVLCFNVAQKDPTNLFIIKKHLGCGTIRKRKDGVHVFEVANPLSIAQKVIPFFEAFPFLSAKSKQNFLLFRRIAALMMQKKHLTGEGLAEIIRLREKLNEGKGRKRKYSIDDYYQSLPENPQRLYAKPRQFRKEMARKI